MTDLGYWVGCQPVKDLRRSLLASIVEKEINVVDTTSTLCPNISFGLANDIWLPAIEDMQVSLESLMDPNALL